MAKSSLHHHRGHRGRIVTPGGHGMGWRPSIYDHRDAFFAPEPRLTANLPEEVDLRADCPPVYDQGQLGSCTGNGSAGILQFARMKQKLEHADRVPSRLQIYYDERVIEGTVGDDSGAEVRDALKVLAKTGACFEDGSDGWPYDVSKFTDKPPQKCYDAAVKDRAMKYKRVVQDTTQLRATLAAGYPIVFGFTCYPEIDSDVVARTGMLPMPKHGEGPVGGHCVDLVGYRNKDRHYVVRNSWGEGWGDKGYFYMPFAYVERAGLSSDFWVIQLAEPDAA